MGWNWNAEWQLGISPSLSLFHHSSWSSCFSSCSTAENILKDGKNVLFEKKKIYLFFLCPSHLVPRLGNRDGMEPSIWRCELLQRHHQHLFRCHKNGKHAKAPSKHSGGCIHPKTDHVLSRPQVQSPPSPAFSAKIQTSKCRFETEEQLGPLENAMSGPHPILAISRPVS